MTDIQKKLTALLFIVFAALFLSFNLPKPAEYYLGADEGNYFKQANEIASNGFQGIKENTADYLNNPEHKAIPNPMRLGHLLPIALFLKLYKSIVALSVYSMLCYIVFIIISFYYIKKLWNIDLALITTILLSISPLGLALARRALADSDYYLFSSLAIFLFIDHISKPSNSKLYLFLLFLTFSWLIRETTFFLLPFFVGYLIYYNVRFSAKFNIKDILLTLFVPVISVFLIYILFFGLADAVSIMKVPVSNEMGVPTGYGLYTRGSWYYYILGFIMLSPYVVLFSFCFIGYTLLNLKADRKEWLLVLLFIYLFIPLGFAHKEIRYGINFDLIIRIFFGLFLLRFYEEYKSFFKLHVKNLMIIVVFLSIIFYDMKSFNNFFIANKIYNPIMYNLMEAEKFIPSESDFNTNNDSQKINSTDQIIQLESQIKSNPSSDNFYALAIAYYSNKEYEKCINANLKAIELKPDFAEAYNNLAAAYGSIGDYAKEVWACEQALEIRPDFQLAKNNLEWAKSMLKETKK